jgi:hypothetical protein
VSTFNLPLSGSVPIMQAFAPLWTNAYTINLGTSAQPDVEKDVLTEVGSYGRQMGRLCDALLLLLQRVEINEEGLSKGESAALAVLRSMPAEPRALEDLHHVLKGVEDIKARYSSKPRKAEV